MVQLDERFNAQSRPFEDGEGSLDAQTVTTLLKTEDFTHHADIIIEH
jgi:hypothetical protein